MYYPNLQRLGLLALLSASLGCVGEQEVVAPPAPTNMSPEPGVEPPPDEITEPEDAPEAAPDDAPLLRRLTDWEYRWTVEDLLGVDAQDLSLPRDRLSQGFSNTALGLFASSQHIESYFLVSQQVAARADVQALLSEHASCERFEGDCAEEFVTSFGTKLFRRPPLPSELGAFLDLYDTVRAEGGTFAQATRFVLEAMLQSPEFLYRVQPRPGDGEIAGFDMAVKLSYFLYSSAPDDALMEAAAAGDLDTREGVREVTERLLAKERSRRGATRFVGDWLRLLWFETIVLGKRDVYDRAPEMKASAFGTLEHHLDEGRPFLDLFTTEDVLVNFGVAPFFDSSIQDGQAPRIENTAGDLERTGILTHPAFVAGFSDQTGDSMVQRGVYLLEALYCTEPISPPAALNVTDFLDHLEEEATQRDYAEDRANDPVCAGCHIGFEPLAFPYEPYDSKGLAQDTNAFGRALRTDGQLMTSGGLVEFETPDDYVRLIREQPEIQRCVSEKLAQYALGRLPETPTEEAWLDAFHEEAQSAGGTWEDMVLALVTSPLFRGQSTD